MSNYDYSVNVLEQCVRDEAATISVSHAANILSEVGRTRQVLECAEQRVDELESAMSAISEIRNSIIGTQQINWSEHIYPLVAALNNAGFAGEDYETAKENMGTLIDQVADMTEALETVLMYMTNVNSVDPITVANRVIQSLKKAGYDERTLDEAAMSMLMGAASVPSPESTDAR